jgi:zinc transport system substrate-binding protein
MFHRARSCVALAALLLCTPAAAEMTVVATMKPVHALVAMVMGDTGAAKLIVDGATSPHTYVLKPSDAKAMGNATVIFRMSSRIETFTVKIAETLPRTTEMVTLAEAPRLGLLPVRTASAFETHGAGAGAKPHDDHDDDDHDASASATDPHVWLDPDNAKAMLDHIAAVLSAKDVSNAGAFVRNAEMSKLVIDAISAEIAAALKPVQGQPYILFHDATQYFERRYGLSAVGAISVNPDVPPSGKRLRALRRTIAASGVRCVFSEPNFEAKIVASVTEGSKAKTGVIDPEGATLPAGPGHYTASLRQLAEAHRTCLSR